MYCLMIVCDGGKKRIYEGGWKSFLLRLPIRVRGFSYFILADCARWSASRTRVASFMFLELFIKKPDAASTVAATAYLSSRLFPNSYWTLRFSLFLFLSRFLPPSLSALLFYFLSTFLRRLSRLVSWQIYLDFLADF